MDSALALIADPSAWLALVTLVAMEIVLGVDNLIFVALLSAKLPEEYAGRARCIGVGFSLIFRVLLLAGAAYVVHLTRPVFFLFRQAFSWRDLILIAGGLFLVVKATREIHESVEPEEKLKAAAPKSPAFRATVVQIALL
ncbi:MAG TPA: TerC family protein, partial [Methylocella sp.]|nr:TerC family protein [Methylocella sp.]